MIDDLTTLLTNHSQDNKKYPVASANHIDEDSDSDTSLIIDDLPITDHKTNSKLTNHQPHKNSQPVQHVINSNSKNPVSVKDFNTRLKQLAVREVKKPGKSKCLHIFIFPNIIRIRNQYCYIQAKYVIRLFAKCIKFSEFPGLF